MFEDFDILMMFLIIVTHQIEGPWKKKNLVDLGIVTQCIAPTRVNDQYITNVLLKINAKVKYRDNFVKVVLLLSVYSCLDLVLTFVPRNSLEE
jgi:hypothetical protein